MATKQIKGSLPHEKILGWVKDNKMKFTLLAIGAVVVLSVAWTIFIGLLGGSLGMSGEALSPRSYSGDMYDSADMVAMESGFDESQSNVATQDAPDGIPDVEPDDIPGLKVVEAHATIDTDDAKREEGQITQLTSHHGGYIEDNRMSEGLRSVNIYMTLRVPSDNFDSFFEDLRSITELKNFNIHDYRIDIERRETELGTLRETMVEYDRIIEEVREMEVDDKRIRLTRDLTNTKMELRRQENRLLDSLQQSRRKSEYSTIRLTINEKIAPNIWPEDIGDSFRENMQKSLDKVVSSLVSALGDIMMILTTVVIWILYILTAVLPLWVTYRLLRKAYVLLYRKK